MGPLKDLKVIELSGIGPGPFAGMLLADMGAEVIAVDRSGGAERSLRHDCHARNKKFISLDLKSESGKKTLLKMVEKADVIFEGFRPGVAERLGIGPEVCLEKNPKIIYGRMTGWGQTGPLAHSAGHDINYIALTGMLNAIGRRGEKPVPPLNVAGDFGGGSLFLVTGILAALLEREKSGKGQVIDAAITDGAALLMSLFHTLHAQGSWSLERGTNLIDSGAHCYDVYETADGKFIALGPLEPKFYKLLMEMLDLDTDSFADQLNEEKWPEMKEKLEASIKSRTREEWCALLEGSDVCFAPVLDLNEAIEHPHNRARNTYTKVGDMFQPAPAPRFSRTPSLIQGSGEPASAETLGIWGLAQEDLEEIELTGYVRRKKGAAAV